MIEWLVLISTAWVAATISGVAGFGGSLIILPVMSHLVGVKRAIPVLTIAWLMGNLSRAAFSHKEIQWRPVLLFSAGAVPAAIAGARLFVELPSELILKGIGVFLLLVVIMRHTPFNRALMPGWLVPVGAMVGFLSSVLGSAGPVGAAAFLSLNLTPMAYVASEAVTAVFMHLTKTIVYGRYNLLMEPDLLLGVILGLAMVAGSWTGKKLIQRLSGRSFLWFAEALLVIAAVSLFYGS